MKMTHFLPLALLWAGATLTATAETIIGSGHVVSETREVASFSGVELHGTGQVVITQGDTEKLTIEAEDNLLPLIESGVDFNHVLRLGFKPHAGSIESKKDVVYRLTVKKLEELTLDGSGSIRAEKLTLNSLTLGLHGSGEIGLDDLQAGGIKVELDGSGGIQLAGHVANQNVNIGGSGEYRAGGLHSDGAGVVVNGSGEAEIDVRGPFDAMVNGSGTIKYHGKPTKFSRKVNGSGEVNALDAKED